MVKRFLPIIIVLLLLLAIKNNISGIFHTLEDKNTAETLRKKLAEEKKKNTFLKERLFYVETNNFVEEEAREKLGMSKPGEYLIIAPTSTPPDKTDIEVNNMPNWQKWLKLFF